MPIFLLHTLPSIRSDKIQAESLSPHPGLSRTTASPSSSIALMSVGCLGRRTLVNALILSAVLSLSVTPFSVVSPSSTRAEVDNTEIFAFDFGKIKQQGYIIRCNIFSWIIA